MGEYLNYMYVLCVWELFGKTMMFLPSIGQLAMPKSFSDK